MLPDAELYPGTNVRVGDSAATAPSGPNRLPNPPMCSTGSRSGWAKLNVRVAVASSDKGAKQVVSGYAVDGSNYS